MPTAAQTQPNQNPSWQNPAWQNPAGAQPAWSQPPFWHPYGMSRPLGIAAMILGFALWWPVGLATLFFLIFSGRIGCRGRRGAHMQGQGSMNWQSPPWARWGCGNGATQAAPQSSGNHAFDEYRTETLRRLEEEQTEFTSFLDRLRFAKDKAEFDQFMAERRQTPRPPVVPDQPSHG